MAKQKYAELIVRPVTTTGGHTTNNNNINSIAPPIQDQTRTIFCGSTEPNALVLTLWKFPVDYSLVGTRSMDGSGNNIGGGASPTGISNVHAGTTNSSSKSTTWFPNNPNSTILMILCGIAIVYCCYKVIKCKLGETNNHVDGVSEQGVNFHSTTEKHTDTTTGLQGIAPDYN